MREREKIDQENQHLPKEHEDLSRFDKVLFSQPFPNPTVPKGSFGKAWRSAPHKHEEHQEQGSQRATWSPWTLLPRPARSSPGPQLFQRLGSSLSWP